MATEVRWVPFGRRDHRAVSRAGVRAVGLGTSHLSTCCQGLRVRSSRLIFERSFEDDVRTVKIGLRFFDSPPRSLPSVLPKVRFLFDASPKTRGLKLNRPFFRNRHPDGETTQRAALGSDDTWLLRWMVMQTTHAD